MKFTFSTQLLGIALRADIPLALDMLPCFWKSLLNLPLDPQDDLRETDILTYNYLRRFSEVTLTSWVGCYSNIRFPELVFSR